MRSNRQRPAQSLPSVQRLPASGARQSQASAVLLCAHCCLAAVTSPVLGRSTRCTRHWRAPWRTRTNRRCSAVDSRRSERGDCQVPPGGSAVTALPNSKPKRSVLNPAERTITSRRVWFLTTSRASTMHAGTGVSGCGATSSDSKRASGGSSGSMTVGHPSWCQVPRMHKRSTAVISRQGFLTADLRNDPPCVFAPARIRSDAQAMQRLQRSSLQSARRVLPVEHDLDVHCQTEVRAHTQVQAEWLVQSKAPQSAQLGAVPSRSLR